MPKGPSSSSFKKKVLILFAALVLVIAVYLNRSYARIFEFDRVRDVVGTNIQRNYSLSGGSGTEDIKYVALGDSLTYGFGARDYRGTYPYIIAEKLLQDYKNVEVVNLGVSGTTTAELVGDQLPQAILEQPNIVTVMTGTNDVHDYVDQDIFRDYLLVIVKELKAINAKVVLINIPYLGTKDLILFPHNLIMDYRIREYNKVIKEVTDLEQVEYFDLYSQTKQSFLDKPEEYYSYDKFHPSDKGYVLWGNMINAN